MHAANNAVFSMASGIDANAVFSMVKGIEWLWQGLKA